MEKIKKVDENVCAIILAAGASRRMGKAKQLLPLGEVAMIEKVIHNVLAFPFEKVYTVIGHHALQIRKKVLIDDTRLFWLYNNYFYKGQSTSLKLALDHSLQEFSHICIFLGDVPFISPKTIKQIINTSTNLIGKHSDTFLVRPIYQNVIGHPVFLGNMTKDLNRHLHGDQGIKSIQNKIITKTMIPVDDHGVIFDIDTPNDYKAAKEYFK